VSGGRSIVIKVAETAFSTRYFPIASGNPLSASVQKFINEYHRLSLFDEIILY
jgi:hypothetical protein